MSEISAKQGREAALGVIKKISPPKIVEKQTPVVSPVDMSPVTEALTRLVESRQDLNEVVTPLIEAIADMKPDPISFDALTDAIAAIELSVNVDLSDVNAELKNLVKQKTVNLKPIEDRLQSIANELKDNTKALRELVKATERPKVVKYNNLGQITFIGIEK